MRRTLEKGLLFGLCAVVSIGIAGAQSPNWQNANDGICDELLGATPGLYGLCLAFCEAHSCAPDFNAIDPFAGCQRSDPKLYDLYTEIQQLNDPYMPCVVLEGGCPCFTQEQIDAIPTPYSQCIVDFDFGGSGLTTNIIHVQGTGAQAELNGTASSCSYGDGTVDPPVFIHLQINLAQAQECRDIIVSTIEANEDQCQLLCDPTCPE